MQTEIRIIQCYLPTSAAVRRRISTSSGSSSSSSECACTTATSSTLIPAVSRPRPSSPSSGCVRRSLNIENGRTHELEMPRTSSRRNSVISYRSICLYKQERLKTSIRVTNLRKEVHAKRIKWYPCGKISVDRINWTKI